jgi:flagellar biosynthetic protein FliR
MPVWAFSESELIAALGEYFWVFCRVGAFFMVIPILGTQLVSPRIRLILGGFITFLLVPVLPAPSATPGFDLATLLLVVEQVILGLAMGFVLQILFQIFILTGQLIAMKMGLGFASMNDPSNGVTVTVLSQFYLMLATLLFLSINGHILMMEGVVNSFTTWPVSTQSVSSNSLFAIANLGSWMFQSSLIMALPVLTSLLIVNIAFGIMSRSAPQMNVFTVGFPITLVFGMVLMYLGLNSFLPNFLNYVDQGFSAMQGLFSP